MTCRTRAEAAAARMTTTFTWERPETTADGQGGVTSTMTSMGTLSGTITATGYSDRYTAAIAEALRGRTPYKVGVPIANELKYLDRLTTDSRVFEVLSVTRSPGATRTRALVAEVV